MSDGTQAEEERVPAVETARVMEEIRARVEERKAAGGYTDEELAAIAGMELRLREQEEYGAEMDRLVSWLHAHWEATGPVDAEGGTASRQGREALKRTLRSLLSPLARLLLSKQNQINAKIVQLLSGTLPPLRESAGDLETRLEDLALRLEKEQSALREEVTRLSARLAEMEGSGNEGESRRGEQ